MTLKDKTDYMRIGLSLVGIPINDRTSELIVRMYEGIEVKKGKFQLSDAIKIESEVQAKYDRLERKKKVEFEKDNK